MRFGSSHHVQSRQLRGAIHGWVRAGWVIFAHIGLPCESWTRARNRPNGPQPLRDATAVMGLAQLRNENERYKINLGNLTLAFSCQVAMSLHRWHCGFVIENPWTSWLWLAPQVSHLRQQRGVRLVRTDMCQWGTPWRKATGLLTNANVSYVERRCHQHGKLCSRSHRPHVVLEGRDASGACLTRQAEVYPRGLARNLARMVDAHHKEEAAQVWQAPE